MDRTFILLRKILSERTSGFGSRDRTYEVRKLAHILCNTDQRGANRLNSDAKRIANGSLLDQNRAHSDHFEAGFERFEAQKVAQRVVIDRVYFVPYKWQSSELSEGAKVPRCQGAKVPRCQGAKVPRCQGAKVPRCHGTRIRYPWHRGTIASERGCAGSTGIAVASGESCVKTAHLMNPCANPHR